MDAFDKEATLKVLNQILEIELAGVVRYTHYSLMIFGYNRIPIVKWLRDQAQEGIDHAQRVGELITQLGGHPSLGIGKLLETHKHKIGDILQESLAHEKAAVTLYHELLELTKDKSVLLEEFSREMILVEELHFGDVEKMLRQS